MLTERRVVGPKLEPRAFPKILNLLSSGIALLEHFSHAAYLYLVYIFFRFCLKRSGAGGWIFVILRKVSVNFFMGNSNFLKQPVSKFKFFNVFSGKHKTLLSL